MNRFKLYIAALIVNIVIFLISLVLKGEYLAGVINFISFLASIILFLFTLEEPPELSKLKIPEVHNYYKSAQNDFNNIIALEFGFLSFLFFILLYSFNFNFSFVVLSLWGLSVPITYYIILKNSRSTQINKISHYLKQFEPESNYSEIKSITMKFISIGNLNRSDLLKINANSPLLMEKLVDRYIYYIKSSENTLVAGEIEEINDL